MGVQLGTAEAGGLQITQITCGSFWISLKTAAALCPIIIGSGVSYLSQAAPHSAIYGICVSPCASCTVKQPEGGIAARCNCARAGVHVRTARRSGARKE